MKKHIARTLQTDRHAINVPTNLADITITRPTWTGFVITSGLWAQIAPPEAVAAFHIDALGYLHMKGTLTTAAGDPGGTTLGTLPVGSRPSENQRFICPSAALLYVLVQPDGQIITGLAVGAGNSLSLANIFFLVG